jgi:environmental stress-induced protein Ves
MWLPCNLEGRKGDYNIIYSRELVWHRRHLLKVNFELNCMYMATSLFIFVAIMCQ